ncbi:MAG: hypothetical protein LBE31_08140, partial [Deltaproteobacteria bacterium]|nr:hypothetical protein [Deltaproteobacteria bacterium]
MLAEMETTVEKRSSYLKPLAILLCFAALTIALSVCVVYTIKSLARNPGQLAGENRVTLPLSPPPEVWPTLDKKALAELIGPRNLGELPYSFFGIPSQVSHGDQ